MMFVEWFIQGAWFVSLRLWLGKGGLSIGEIGQPYACTVIATILSPILVSPATDRFFSTRRAPAVLMSAGAVLIYFAAQQTIFAGFFPLLLACSLAYMLIIALTNSIAFANVPDVGRDFPRIHVVGIIDWIASGLACGFLPQILEYANIPPTNIPLLIAAGSSALFGVFTFFLSGTPPRSTGKMDIKVMLGLDTLILLRDKNFLVPFFCSFLFTTPLAFYYIFANSYLTGVSMKNTTGWMALGQFSEVFSVLALPFFTKHSGVRKVLLLGLVAVAIRYSFFTYDSTDEHFTYALLFLGILLHGVNCDLCYVTAYIYVDKKTPVHMRTAAQGLITSCYQGLGNLLSYRPGGVMMEKMFAYQEPVNGLTFSWAGMWTFGAVMIVIIAVLFMIFFRESNSETMAIKVDDHGTALVQRRVK